MKLSSSIREYIICPLVRIIYTTFKKYGKGKSKSNPANIGFQLLFNQWMCLRFNCKDCSFKYPINLRLNEKYFRIGSKSSFGKYAVLTAWDSYAGEKFTPKVIIGENCNFGDFLHLTCINRIEIGNNVLTGRWVTITDNNHGKTDLFDLSIPPANRKLFSKGPVKIEDKVWIGDKATILPGITIGEGAVIGANTVVSKDIPPYSIVVGNPAKIYSAK